MLISHVFEDRVLHVTLLRDLDVAGRAAAALHIETLLSAHCPRHVRIQLPTTDPSRPRSACSPAPAGCARAWGSRCRSSDPSVSAPAHAPQRRDPRPGKARGDPVTPASTST